MNILRNLFRSRTPAERDMDPKLAAAALLVEAALVDGGKISTFESLGFVWRDGDRMGVTSKGMPVLDALLGELVSNELVSA